MNVKQRIELLKAMDTIARCTNDERDYELWATYGIPDGEIKEDSKDDDLEWMCEDKIFADLMFSFCLLFKMKRCTAEGFLYCDSVTSKEDI